MANFPRVVVFGEEKWESEAAILCTEVRDEYYMLVNTQHCGEQDRAGFTFTRGHLDKLFMC